MKLPSFGEKCFEQKRMMTAAKTKMLITVIRTANIGLIGINLLPENEIFIRLHGTQKQFINLKNILL